MSLTSADIKNIMEALHESEWDTASVVVGDVSISVSRNGAGAPQPLTGQVARAVAVETVQPAAPAVPAAEPTTVPVAPAQPEAPEGFVAKSPSVGVFWSAPEPGAAPFVQVGQRVEKGDTLCIVEIMKLMNTVSADVAGTVVAVHVENAQAVEYGTPLFTIANES